ncbi:MAG: hypothetical protein E7257_00210 [Lachnospiraceae bacterium]|nr:hypothetical protein [Lachnospiraceae bacterium]
MKKLLCIASLMLMVFLVGCKKETLDLADLQHDWQFVEVETAGEVTPHTPGFESREPSASFSDDSITFSINGKNTYYGVVEAAEDCYNITFPNDSRKPMVAKLSDDGNTLTITVESLDVHFRFKKQ